MMRLHLIALALLALPACRSVDLGDLTAPRPVPAGSCLVIGFLGGKDAWDDDAKGVRRTALALRDADRRIWAETFENRRLDVALAFVRQALDADRDGSVAAAERARAQLIVYGQSLGGWATVVFARLLARHGIAIDLTIQIDSVGALDAEIPPNVRTAANLYQNEGSLVAGEAPIRAVDPSRTRVLGNWEFHYDRPPGSAIEVDDLPWWKTAFRADHTRMDRDPRVWALVERLIEDGCRAAE